MTRVDWRLGFPALSHEEGGEVFYPLGVPKRYADDLCARWEAEAIPRKALREFEEMDHTPPPAYGGAAKVATAKTAFKVGDRVRVHGKHTGTIRSFSHSTGGPRIQMDSGFYCVDDCGLAMFPENCHVIELIEPAAAPVDDGWIEWDGRDSDGPCLYVDAEVAIRRRYGQETNPHPISHYRWSNSGSIYDVVAYKVVTR